MAAISDPISDFLIRFKNASRAGNETFRSPYSKMRESIAKILKEQGYIWSFEVNKDGQFPELFVKLRYVNGRSALTDLKRISKPGVRQYVSKEEIPRVLNGMGVAILSTSKGVMTGQEARKENVGGEILAKVW